MKFKKLVTLITSCILLCCVLLLSFTGCVTSKQPSDDSSSNNESDESESTSVTAEKDNLKGPGKKDILEFSIMLDAIMWAKNNKDINESEELKKWSEYSNTKLSFITPPSSSYNEKLNIMIAGSDLPDVIVTSSNVLTSLIEAEAIISVDDLFDEYGKVFAKKNEDKGWRSCKIEGVTYGIPVYSTFYAQHGFIARKDWLDNLGMDLPKTLDDYVKVAKAFTYDDPDQNGEDDTYGITFRQNFSYASGFLRAFDVDSNTGITYDDINGELMPQQA